MTITPKTVFLALAVSFILLLIWSSRSPSSTASPSTPSASTPAAYQTKESEGGNVTVIVTPQELGTGKPAVFQIVFDTHSVNLDSDVAQASALRDDQGNTYGTPAWKGDPPGGHHRKGTLSFPTPLKQIPAISLILKDIAGVQERTFVWKL